MKELKSITDLTYALSKFPSIGNKTAERMSYALLDEIRVLKTPCFSPSFVFTSYGVLYSSLLINPITCYILFIDISIIRKINHAFQTISSCQWLWVF